MAELLLPDIWFQTSEERKELIGEGSYGKVYKVTDPEGNVSAIKIIHIPERESQLQNLRNEMKDSELLKNYLFDVTNEFSSEIRTMEKFKDSKNIIRLKSHYVEADQDGYRWKVYIQMEFLESLHTYFSAGKVDENKVIQMGIDLCHALVDCHKKNIIHRDIKPDNIMVTSDGIFKLADFGIARHMEKTLGTMSQKGTLAFMAPEVHHGARYGKNVDIYSLGLVMYRLLNKDRDPFIDPDQKIIRYKDKENAIKKRMDGIEIPPARYASKELDEIIGRAIAFKQEERYQDAEDMLRDLQDLQKGVYRLGKSWADKDFAHRSKLFLYHHKYKILAGVLLCVGIIGGLRFSQIYKAPVKVEEWQMKDLPLSMDQKQSICDEVMVYDDIIWDYMKENDSESFRIIFSDYSEEDFENFLQEYYMLADSKENLGEDYEKYIENYHNDCNTYPHIISMEEDRCYVEVCRYYIKREEEDYQNLKNLQEYYQGHLMQATAYYEVELQDDEITNVNLFRQGKKTNSDSISNHINLYDALFQESHPGVQNVYQSKERENANFLFTENDFEYDGFFRVDQTLYYIDENAKTITFAISIKNGMDREVLLKTLNITYQMEDMAEDFPGEDEDYNLNWVSESGKNQCILLTYPLKKTGEINMDTYQQCTGIRIDYQNDLEGVE